MPRELREVFQRALSEYLPASYVYGLLENFFFSGKIRLVYAYKDKPRGIVGAVSALAAYPLEEYTYELLVYRNPEDRALTRNIDPGLFLEIDRRYRPYIFSTFDYYSDRLLAVPHGTDPVLFGLRSLNPDMLLEALSDIEGKIDFLGYVIFKTNQATNMHLKGWKSIAFLRPYDSIVIQGHVNSNPCLLYTSPSPRDRQKSRMPSSA